MNIKWIGAFVVTAVFLTVTFLPAQVVQQPSPGPVGVCAFNTTPPTLSDGQAGMIQCDATGNARVAGTLTPSGTQAVNQTQVNGIAVSVGNGVSGTGVQRVAIASDNTPFGVTGPVTDAQLRAAAVPVLIAGSSFTNITTNADTNVKASAGTFVGIVVNTIGTTSTAAVYNDADGTCSTGLIGTFSTLIQTSLIINADATVGICVTTAGAGAANITILWR